MSRTVDVTSINHVDVLAEMVAFINSKESVPSKIPLNKRRMALAFMAACAAVVFYYQTSPDGALSKMRGVAPNLFVADVAAMFSMGAMIQKWRDGEKKQ